MKDESPDELDELRGRVSTLNREILDRLNDRLRLVSAIRGIKLARGLPLYDPAREEEMLEDLMAANAGPLSARGLGDVFRQIFGVSLAHLEDESRATLRVHRRAGETGTRRVEARGHGVGNGPPALIAGPCAVEDHDSTLAVARHLHGLGCRLLRGGAYKPRTSPYSFQGLGVEGWRILRAVADELGMAVVSEVLDPRHLDEALAHVDIIQVGARNMYNYELLKALGQTGRPVLLKRSFMATLEELLLAVEYLAAQGNMQIILCERGIRTFERWTRNTLDIAAVPLLKQATALPVVVDVAHAAGRRDIQIPLARAALAAGADGIMLEVHPRPALATSDAEHQLDLAQTSELVAAVFGPSGPPR